MAVLAGLGLLGIAGLLVAFVTLGGRPGSAAVPTSTATATPSSTPEDQPELGRPFGRHSAADDTPCSGAGLDCELLTVPVDQFEPGLETMEVLFGVRRAPDEEERIGTLVVATGGPGSSGIKESAFYLDLFADSVVDRYDLVFFEQRGVGRSAGVRCPDAIADEPRWASLALGPASSAHAAGQRWVARCLDEAGIASDGELDRFGTLHAAADLDAYLDHIGAGPVVIYGVSYGTELAQAYAALRPERVSGLVLDSPVDPTLDPVTAIVEQVTEAGLVLDGVLSSCAHDPLCVADFGDADAIAVWDDLADRLISGPIAVETAVKGDGAREISVDLTDLISLTARHLYTEHDRGILLRLLAAAGQGDLAPLARTTELMVGRDPETGQVLPSADGSFAPLLAIDCQAHAPGGGVAGVDRLGDRSRRNGGRMETLSFIYLPCLSGFAGPTAEAKPDWSRLYEADIPTLVLVSTRDPATPPAWGGEIVLRFRTGRLVTSLDGPHGTFGRHSPCVDDAVNEFLVFGDLPDSARTTCSAGSIASYRPLSRSALGDYDSILDALTAIEEELWVLPDFQYWDGSSRSIGCPHAGEMRMLWVGQPRLTLDGCELIDGWPLTGRVVFKHDGTTTMSLQWPDALVEYESDAGWEVTVTGTVDGESIDLHRP